MKAAVLHAPGQGLEIVDRERPTPGPGQVLIRVHACGICYSDFALAQGYFPFAKYPTVPGHEIAGVIEERGQGVTWPEVGARVGLPWLYSSCGHCKQCVRGNEILCPAVQVSGVTVDGGYQEYMVAPANYVAPLPDDIDFVHAGPLMDAGVTVFNGLRRGGFEPGDRVAVIGLGGLGHLAIRFAVAMGGRVAVVSRNRDSEEMARHLGAEHFIASSEGNIGAALHTWDGGADVILNTASTSRLASDAVAGLAPDGTLVILGYDATPITADAGVLAGSRLHIMGSPSGSRHDLRDSLELASAHQIVPDVTPVRLEQVPDILARLGRGEQRGRAVLVFE